MIDSANKESWNTQPKLIQKIHRIVYSSVFCYIIMLAHAQGDFCPGYLCS